MSIPSHRAGLIIGKGGEMIRQLQERCQVKMNMIQDAPQSGVGNKTLRILGEPDKVEAAKQQVNDIINRSPQGPQMNGAGGGAPPFGGMGMYGQVGVIRHCFKYTALLRWAPAHRAVAR